MNREITVEVKSSLNLPSVREMRVDIEKLRQLQANCREVIAGNKTRIVRQQEEQRQLLALAEDPVGEDGIRYNSQACRKAADRCDKHIGRFLALNKKEHAKIEQLEYMVAEIEGRICLSEQMSQ